MSNANTENTRIGRSFQKNVQEILQNRYGMNFEWEPSISIGTPPKNHKFDLANEDRTIVASANVIHGRIQVTFRVQNLWDLIKLCFILGFCRLKL